MQQEQRPTSPLQGLKLKLERATDIAKPCCNNFAIACAGKGPHAAELRCARCGSHRGWLPKEAANWLTAMLTQFPEAQTDVHVIRDGNA
jgi:hypothetical protein